MTAEKVPEEVLEGRAKRLRLIRHMLEMRTAEFAQYINAGDSTVRYWETGKGSGLTGRGAVKIINALESSNLRCSIDWLLYGKGNLPSFKDETASPEPTKIPEPSASASDDTVLQTEMDLFRSSHHNAIVLKITDDAMSPYFKPGDYVGGRWVQNNQISELIGQICLVQTIDGMTLLRKINSHVGGKIFQLSCINSGTTKPLVFEAEVLAAAPVIRLWR